MITVGEYQLVTLFGFELFLNVSLGVPRARPGARPRARRGPQAQGVQPQGAQCIGSRAARHVWNSQLEMLALCSARPLRSSKFNNLEVPLGCEGKQEREGRGPGRAGPGRKQICILLPVRGPVHCPQQFGDWELEVPTGTN